MLILLDFLVSPLGSRSAPTSRSEHMSTHMDCSGEILLRMLIHAVTGTRSYQSEVSHLTASCLNGLIIHLLEALPYGRTIVQVNLVIQTMSTWTSTPFAEEAPIPSCRVDGTLDMQWPALDSKSSAQDLNVFGAELRTWERKGVEEP